MVEKPERTWVRLDRTSRYVNLDDAVDIDLDDTDFDGKSLIRITFSAGLRLQVKDTRRNMEILTNYLDSREADASVVEWESVDG